MTSEHGLRVDRRTRGRAPAASPTCPSAGLATALSSSRWRSASRCCSRARRAWARPSWPRRWRARAGARLIRLQCYEGLDVSHAVYEWNYARQLLHIRAAQEGAVDEQELFGPEFLIRRPLLEAIASEEPVVLLIDEIDRADDEFEAFLLEVLSDFQITIPEIGTIAREAPPAGHPHLQPHARAARRAQAPLPLPLDHASRRSSARSRSCACACPACPSAWPPQAAAFVAGLRDLDLAKAPGVAETIDWAQALVALGCEELDATVVEQTLGAVLKYHEDFEMRPRRRRSLALLGEARARRGRAARVSEALTRHIVTFGRVLREAGLEVGAGPRGRRAARPRPRRHHLARRTSTGRCARRSWRGARTSSRSTAPSTPGSCAARARAPAPPRGRPAHDAQGARARVRRDPQHGPRGGARRGRARQHRPQRPRGAAPQGLRGDDARRSSRRRARSSPQIAVRAARRGARTGCAAHRRGRVLDMRAPGARRASPPAATRSAAAIAGARRRPASSSCCATSRARWRPTSRALLLYLHAIVRLGRGVEVFAFGTRLTRLTRRAAHARSRAGARARRATASSTGRRARGSARR